MAYAKTEEEWGLKAVAHLKGHIQSVETTATGLILRYGKARPAQR